jgi:type I restriction enzyme S subunit
MGRLKLRNKSFHEEWESPCLEDVFELRNGYTPSKSVSKFWEDGDIPWFRMEDIRLNGGILSDSIQHITKDAVKGSGLFKPFSILLATTATIGVHAMPIVDSLANQRFTNLKIRKSLSSKYDPYFVYYSFFRIDQWAKNNTNSGGLLSVDIKGLMKQPFPTPSIEEQHRIASYFQSLDELIQSSQKKVEGLKQLKSASMISMFPQNGETKPRVRFNGFDSDWEYGKLSKYATRIVRKNQKLESSLPLTISAMDGLIAQDSFFNSKIASSNLRGYYLLKKGEFAYNKSYSNGYPYGAVKRLEKFPMGALSVLYIVFALNEFISHDYMVQFFETTLWHKEVAKRAAEGARNHGLLNISAEDFLDIQIVYPQNIEEQRKIASFFTNLDCQIALETQRLEKLKQIKSACLDKMFV